MPQMYKVFINNKEINFHYDKPSADCPDILVVDKSIFDSFYETLENFAEGNDYAALFIYGDLPEKLFVRFASYFHLIEAAGGIVKNSKDEILFIFRNGKWDLPKGKIENGETPETAAIREVMEECGLLEIRISEFIGHTFHIYNVDKNNFILKKNWWFEMFANESQPLIPQSDEGIEKIEWVSKSNLHNVIPSVYASLQYLLEKYLNK
jgi:8-oxo-dGTP pyrophosphatase MutT (NUDIX family)